MKRILIDKEKNFYKANLHCHSTNSDGKLTPQQLKQEYKKRGYSVLAITDHEHLIDNSCLDDEEFITITSCEVAVKEFAEQSTLKNYNMRVAHLNFYALEQHNILTPCYNSVYDHFLNDNIKNTVRFKGEYQRNYSSDGINEMIAKANEEGFIVSYNHPGWSLENSCDYLNYSGFFAVEIYNHGVVVAGGIDDERVLDDFWRAGKPILCTCADDSHRVLDDNSDAFGGWVQIAAKELTYKSIMHSLQVGDFYSSCGPEIYSLIIEDDVVKIWFSDCVAANLITRGRRTAAVRAEEGSTINYAEFEVFDDDNYFRITVVDQTGKKAYTQVYEI